MQVGQIGRNPYTKTVTSKRAMQHCTALLSFDIEPGEPFSLGYFLFVFYS